MYAVSPTDTQLEHTSSRSSSSSSSSSTTHFNMVGPLNLGPLVMSLVRLPGSGWDESAGSSPLDLSRASPLAATVSVPMTLPTVSRGGGGGGGRRQVKYSHTSQKLHDVAAAGIKMGHSPQLSVRTDSVPAKIVCLTPQKLNHILKENIQLKERVRSYQQLFRDRKRLASVVKRLGVIGCMK